MDRISIILKEELQKLFLKENLNLNNLGTYGNNLEQHAKELGKYDASAEKNDTKVFLRNLIIYSLQIVYAIKRCVNAQNINEGYWSNLGNKIGNLRNYGIEMPNEVTFWNDTRNGYNATKRFLTKKKTNNNAVGNDVNTKTIKSEKLSVLLQNYINYENTYKVLTSKYGSIGTQIPEIILFTDIKGLIIPEYQQILSQYQQTQIK